MYWGTTDPVKMTHDKNDVPKLPLVCGVCTRYEATGVLIPINDNDGEPDLNVCDACGQLLRLYAVLSNGTGLRALPPPPPRWVVRDIGVGWVLVIATFAYAAYLILR